MQISVMLPTAERGLPQEFASARDLAAFKYMQCMKKKMKKERHRFNENEGLQFVFIQNLTQIVIEKPVRLSH